MTLDEIETFVSIARFGSFSEASRRLARSQPAISRRIGQLEGHLGAELLVRAGRAVSLTDAGRALLPHAEATLAAARDGARAVRDVRGIAGPAALKVAIVGTLADSYLVEALREFERRFTATSVELTTATSREVSALVRSGDAHVGLRYFPDADPGLESKPLGAEELVLVVPAAHRIRQKRLRDLRGLRGERWLGFAPERGQPDSFGRVLERTLAKVGVAEPRYTTVDSLTAQKRLIEAGLGIALMPRSSIREELRIGSLRAVELAGLGLEQPVVAVCRRGGYASPAVTAFLEVLRRATPGLRRRTR